MTLGVFIVQSFLIIEDIHFIGNLERVTQKLLYLNFRCDHNINWKIYRMAPNADQSRIRHRFNNGDELFDTNGDEALIQSDHSPSPIALKDLKGTEVAIDGVVYDMKGFKHPGGDSVLIFGGNDVTVQYKMIHPYHSSKHLEKMKRVGKLNPLDCQHE